MRYVNTKGESSLTQGVLKKISKFTTETSHQKEQNKNELADIQTNKRVRQPNRKA